MVKSIAKFTFELKGQDLENRGAIAQLMAIIQLNIEKYDLPVSDWRLDSFTKAK